MATPPNPTDGNPPNPATVPPTNDQQDADKGAAKETSIFVNTEPIREDQVQNAVKFLQHPKVKGSPVMYRRSFLERKGLTKEEIDEAFRRVPDESPSISTTQTTAVNQGGQSQPTYIQPQASTQSLQPAVAAPAAPGSTMGTLRSSRFHWSHAILAVGVLAVSGAGTAVVFKNAVVPRLKSWIRKVAHEDREEDVSNKSDTPTLAEEAAAAAKAAAAAASDVARASQEILASKIEEKRYFGELMSLLDVQVQEMKLMSNSIRQLEGQRSIVREVQVTSSRPSYANGRADYANGRADYDSRSARSLSPTPAVETSAIPPHQRSYAEMMPVVQRGERPPNTRQWETAQSQGNSIYPQENSNGLNSYVPDNGSGPAPIYGEGSGSGSGSAPWWQQKNGRNNEVEPTGYPGGNSERPIQRPSWVPPQPPPVAMAEAAAAIRAPKKRPSETEQLTDEQLLARSAEATDELQRITKISESGGVSEGGEGSSVISSTTEIQQEEQGSYHEV